MSNVSDLHNKMYKDSYDSGLPTPVSFLIRNFSKPREEIINEYVTEGDSVVDLGCGNGNFCQIVSPKFKKVYGLDFASESIANAQKRNIENAEFQVFDLNTPPLPFSDQSIDSVVSIVTLDYVYNLNPLIREIKRILKPGGKLIIQVNNLGFLLRRLRLLFGGYPKISSVAIDEWTQLGWDASACHLFTRKELSVFIKSFGFSINKISGSGVFRHFRRWYPSLLCGDLIFVCENKGL